MADKIRGAFGVAANRRPRGGTHSLSLRTWLPELMPKNREKAHNTVTTERNHVGDGDLVSGLGNPAHQRRQNRSGDDRHHDAPNRRYPGGLVQSEYAIEARRTS